MLIFVYLEQHSIVYVHINTMANWDNRWNFKTLYFSTFSTFPAFYIKLFILYWNIAY